MKIFIYKTLIIAFVSLIIFEVLIGRRINSIESQIYHLKSKQNIEQVKTKIFNEIKDGSEKDAYFTEEERNILSNFINKIISELNIQNK
tara:strand:+ start:1112 stop:1378 length:267 start_codon:yes stop_codon:yes gene_type:complete